VSEVFNLALAWPLIVYLLAVIALVVTMLVLSWLLGERRTNAATNDPFESGVVSVGSAQGRISVEFYLIAIFFVIFDLETVFIFAWAIAFFELGWQGYFSMVVFVSVLIIGLIYEWRSGALEWGVKTRTGLATGSTPSPTPTPSPTIGSITPMETN
jgi:NADH-quinone oxidoreductase subunit A